MPSHWMLQQYGSAAQMFCLARAARGVERRALRARVVRAVRHAVVDALDAVGADATRVTEIGAVGGDQAARALVGLRAAGRDRAFAGALGRQALARSVDAAERAG